LPHTNAEVLLQVQDPDPTHVGRNIVTLDKETKTTLAISSGDIVEIEGVKKTAAIVWPARTEDEGKKIIRMDSFIRHNAGIGLNDKVKVRKVAPQEAKRVTLAPIEEVRIIASGYDRILKKSFLGRPLTIGDNVWVSVFGSGFIYKVVETQPRGIVKVTDSTVFSLKDKPTKEAGAGILKTTYDDVGGLEEQVRKVREMVELPLRHPELFHKFGVVPPKGVLLYGPPGTGKTLLAKAVASEAQVHFISISAPEIMGKFVGEAEERVRNIFKDAQDNAPAIIFIDEIDAIASKRDEATGEVERRVVAQLLSLMDGLESQKQVMVMASTNRINSIDEALRRPGRFDREIEFGAPGKEQRMEILLIHTRSMPLAKDVDLKEIAGITHGFVGADFQALTKEAVISALRRYLPLLQEYLSKDEPVPTEVLEKLLVTKDDFQEALKDVQPSALREVLVDRPNVYWKDVGGLDNVKDELKQVIDWPIKHPDIFRLMGISPPRGVLLYGPPGTGKTLLAKAIATESGINFISVRGPELMSKWVGESEKAIKEIFRKARQVSPCIVFFDEFDSFYARGGEQENGSSVKRGMFTQLLTELDGISSLKNVIFIAATNRPDLIDPSLLRAGRIDKIIFVPAPDAKAREAIFKVHLSKVNLEPDVSIKELVQKTEGFSGAELEGMIREASLLVLKENKMKSGPIKMSHFLEVLKNMKPVIDAETIQEYEKFKEKALDFRPTYVG